LYCQSTLRGEDSSVSKVTGYGLDNGSSILGKDKNYSRRHDAQTGSGTYPAPYAMTLRDSFPRNKAVGARS